jgi:hypothetical protein
MFLRHAEFFHPVQHPHRNELGVAKPLTVFSTLGCGFTPFTGRSRLMISQTVNRIHNELFEPKDKWIYIYDRTL